MSQEEALRKLQELPPIPGGILAAPLPWEEWEQRHMGMSVDVRYGSHCEIVDALIKAGCKDGPLLDKILGKFGVWLGDQYVILNNEHVDANPFYELGDVLEAAFDPVADGRFFSILLEHTHTGVNYADASTVCEELGIKWPDSDDWK